MVTALIFGFADIYFPLKQYSYERLHIFLFNLCIGGTILLYYTEAKTKISGTVKLFFAGSLIYALSAFFKIYPVTIIISVPLVVFVEKIRIKKFSILPVLFFKPGESVSEKFHEAALLCLSTGLVIADIVILNNEYFKLITIEKLTLNTFFLGFSFPLSLITLSVVFSMMENTDIPSISILMNICFWTITLGVIVFFVFILFEKFTPQIFVTFLLFAAVVTVFFLYLRFADKIQQKMFLTSGIGFLILTALTGILYIFMEMSSNYDPEKTKLLIHLHVFASLYGWNLCGLSVIYRFNDFPIKMHSSSIIFLHWLMATVLAPMGIFYKPCAIFAVSGYAFITFTLFLSKNDDIIYKKSRINN